MISLFGDLHPAADEPVGACVGRGRLDEVCASAEDPRTLWSSHAFTAAVDHHVRALCYEPG